MSPLRAALLGLVQGVTEFLPISSSAHLIVVSYFLGWEDQGLHFDMAAHAGSLLAVIVYFRQDLWRLVKAALGSIGSESAPDPQSARLAWQLLAATVPVAIVGFLLQDVMASWARRVLLIAVVTIVFGLLLGWADKRHRPWRGLEGLDMRSVLGIGLAQALALIPGTSRSGITITAGLVAGLSRQNAAHFSFLLAVPVGLLVGAKDLFDLLRGSYPSTEWPALAIGFAVSAVSAYVAIYWLLAWVRRQNLIVFVVYRVIQGLWIIALAL